jgi:hypothetical protein
MYDRDVSVSVIWQNLVLFGVIPAAVVVGVVVVMTRRMRRQP